MVLQDDRSTIINSGTVEGLMAFCDYLVAKGYASSGAVTPWKSAAKQVFEAIDGPDYATKDIRQVDIDECLERFENMERGNYKAESLQSYASRVRKAHEAYLAFLSDGRTPQLRRGGARRQRDDTAGGYDGSARPAAANQSRPASDDLVDYPFPLRTGQLAYVRLPRRLEKADAERLAAFVRTLVFEPQLELGRAAAAEEAS